MSDSEEEDCSEALVFSTMKAEHSYQGDVSIKSVSDANSDAAYKLAKAAMEELR